MTVIGVVTLELPVAPLGAAKDAVFLNDCAPHDVYGPTVSEYAMGLAWPAVWVPSDFVPSGELSLNVTVLSTSVTAALEKSTPVEPV